MGYFLMDNDLFDAAAKAGFSLVERAVLDCLLRYTRGFQRETCEASASFIARYAGRSLRGIQQGIASLIRKGVILPAYRPGKATRWHIAPVEAWNCSEHSCVTGTTEGDETLRTPYEQKDETDTKFSAQPLRRDVHTREEQGENKDKVQKESTETRSPKRVFGLYENVLLTEAERSEFERRYSDAESRIDRLSTYLRETGKRYSDHYAVLCRWAKEDGKRPQRTPCGGLHRGNLHLDEAEKRTYDIAAFDEMDFTNTLDFTGNTS